MDAIEVDERTRKQLLKLVATIYKDHWRNTWEVQKPAMREATADLNQQIDLQPVLEAIVTQAVPMRAHTRICTEAFDAEYAAKCDETKEAATGKILEQERKRMVLQQHMLAQLAD